MRFATMTLTLSILLATTTVAVAAPADAVPTRPEMRQEIQQQYILTALWEGRLQWTEAKALLQEQDVVRIRMARFRTDGELSAREVAVLDYMLDISSKNIDVFLEPATPRPAEQQRTASSSPARDPRVAALLARL